MRKIIFCISFIFFSTLNFKAWSQAYTDINDSLGVAVYTKIKSLEDFYSFLIANKNSSPLCAGLIKDSYQDSESKIFFSGEVEIKDDISNDIPSDTSRDLQVSEYFTNYMNQLSQNKITGFILKDCNISPLYKGKEFSYLTVNCNRIFIRPKDSVSYPRKIDFRLDTINGVPRLLISYIGSQKKIKGEFKDLEKIKESYLRKKIGKDYLAYSDEQRDSILHLNYRENLFENAKVELYKENERKRTETKDSLIKSFISEAQKLENQEEWEKAEQELNKAANVDSSNVILLAEKKSLEDKRPSFEKLKKQADVFYEQRNLPKSLDYFVKANTLKNPPDAAVADRITEINSILSKIKMENTKINDGKIDEAISDLQSTIQTKSDVPEYYERLGDCWKQKDRIEEAIQNYKKADQYGLKYSKLKIAGIYKKTGKYYDAIDYYTNFLNLYSTNDSVHNELAEVYYSNFLQNKKNNLNDAIDEVTKAIVINDSNYRYHLNRGFYYYINEKISESRTDFNKAIALHPSEFLAYYYRGRTWLKENKYKEAGLDFDSAVQNKLGKAEADTILAFSILLGRQGATLLENKKYDAALECFNNSIFICKMNYEAFYNRGITLFNKKRYAESKEDFTQSIKENKFHEKGIFYMAACDFFLTNFSSCIELLTPLTINPLISDSLKQQSYNFIGKSFFEQKNFEKALTDFNLSLTMNKDQPEIYFLSGKTNFNLKKYDISIENYSKAIKLKSDDPEYYYYRGLSYFKNAEWKNSIEDFKINFAMLRTDELKTKFKDALNYQGQAEQNNSSFSEALSSFNKFVSLDGNNPEAYYRRASVQTNLNKISEAINDYKIAIDKDSSHTFAADVNLKIGDLYFTNDSISQASRYYSIVHETTNQSSCDPSLPGLAKVKLWKDDIDAAADYLKQYISKCKPDIKELSKTLSRNKNIKQALKNSKIKSILQY